MLAGLLKEEVDAVRDLLPERTAEMAEVAGLDTALKFAELYGGRRVYIPKNPPKNHYFCGLIGWPAVELLARHYGGQDIEINKCDNLRRAIVVRQFMNGVTTSVLAIRNRCTERTIRNWVANSAGNTPQARAGKTLDWIEQFCNNP
jgi:hypothetical protein